MRGRGAEGTANEMPRPGPAVNWPAGACSEKSPNSLNSASRLSYYQKPLIFRQCETRGWSMKGELQSYLAILESEPDNERALVALEELAPKVKEDNGLSLEAASRALSNARRVHRERNDWDLVARLLDLELGWTNDPGRRADLLYEKGRVLSDELLRDSAAIACFEKVLELRSDDQAAQEVLSQVALV